MTGHTGAPGRLQPINTCHLATSLNYGLGIVLGIVTVPIKALRSDGSANESTLLRLSSYAFIPVWRLRDWS